MSKPSHPVPWGRIVLIGMACQLVLLPVALMADHVPSLVMFENGKVANADDVNSNFEALTDTVNTNWDAFVAHAGSTTAHPASLPPSGAAGGDLSGTYPNPQVVDGSHAHGYTLVDCAWSACLDTPAEYICPAGKVMVAASIPEFGGDQSTCGNTDDVRFRCCSLSIR